MIQFRQASKMFSSVALFRLKPNFCVNIASNSTSPTVSCGENNKDGTKIKDGSKKFSWTLDPKVELAINKQIIHELSAAYMYTVLGCYFESPDILLPGFAKLQYKHSKEEQKHARLLCKLMAKRGSKITFCPVAPPDGQNWKSPLAALKAALQLEDTTFKGLIHLVKAAEEAGDKYTCHFVESKLFDMNCVAQLQRHIKMLEAAENPADLQQLDLALQNQLSSKYW